MSTSNPAPERSATTAGTLHLNRRGQAIPQPNPPQRSASLGTETIYTRRRQGAQDWNEHNTAPISWPANLARGDSSRAHNGGGVGDISSEISTGGGGASAALTDDDDWDVESAVERRVVQVMFTVPRGSLRVVNAGPDPDPELDLDLDSDERGTGDGVVVVDKGKGKGRDMDR